MFGEERLLSAVRGRRHESPEDIVEGALCAVRDFCGKDVMEDDVTVIIIKAEMEAQGHVNSTAMTHA
jgi:serine phosphatase RsbU (regulator of sigma subunit)